MRNINRLLENSERSDVRGYNIYTMGRYGVNTDDYGSPVHQKWHRPVPGLFGVAAVGYEIDQCDLVVPCVHHGDTALSFSAVRHRWTPAYSDTYYRCDPIREYQVAGTLMMREKKCFTTDDTFISQLEFINDDSSPITLEISLSVPFESMGDGAYRVVADTVVTGLKSKPRLSGFAVARTSRGAATRIDLPPHGKCRLMYGFAFSKNALAAAEEGLSAAFLIDDPFGEAEERFNRWMEENAPHLETDDTDMLKVYYYRFFLIKSAIHTPSDVLENAVFPKTATYESPFGHWFGCPIGLSIPLQIDEMRWMRTKAAVCDLISAWCDSLGNTQNYIQYTPMAILRYYQLTGDASPLREAYPACRRFALKKSTEKTPGRLPVTIGSWQTGAEYQPSFYQFTDPAWDWRCDNEGIRLGLADSARVLYRADECSFHVANLMACRDMAYILGISEDFAYFDKAVGDARKALVDMLWNTEECCFFDRDVKTGRFCDQAKNYAGFLPLIFGIFGSDYASALDLLKSGSFDSGFSITTASKDCPMYWFDSHIVHGGGTTKSAPHHYFNSWNGAVWPFASSLVLEALGGVAARKAEYIPLFLRLFSEYTELHFLGGDRSLPCMVEHYRVSDGLPLSPYTEYFHSKWLDIFFSYWAGIHSENGKVGFIPMTDKDFVIDGVIIGGASYRFEQKKGNRTIARTSLDDRI